MNFLRFIVMSLRSLAKLFDPIGVVILDAVSP